MNLTHSSAKYSPCRKYRYTLKRVWNKNKPLAAFIGLNPSTATEIKNDPTVNRCMNYANDWGYGGIIMLNIFAYRATDPKEMKAVEEPVGKHTDFWLQVMAQEAALTLACWGTHGEHLARGKQVLALVDNLKCLGTTKHGHPKHPLYLKKDLKPLPFG
jgi:hypothetical protein